MWVLFRPGELIKFQKIRFYILLILGGFWSFTLLAFFISYWNQYLTNMGGLFAVVVLVAYFIIFPFMGAKDARKKIKAHSKNVKPIPIPFSTFVAVILSIFFVYAIFPKDVLLFAGGIPGIFFAILVGTATVFGSYRIVGAFLEYIFSKIRRNHFTDKERDEALKKLATDIIERYEME